MKRILMFLLFSSLILLSLGASTKKLTYHCAIDKGKKMTVSVNWNLKDQADSSVGYQDELAKAALVLSRSIYISEKALEKNINKLGYSKFWLQDEEGAVSNPVVGFAYQKHSGTNYYLVVVRGTASFSDFLTDLKSQSDYFQKAGDNTLYYFRFYLKNILKKTEKQVKEERNVFFVVGHSMGAAIANLLSESLMEYAPKNKIFTYTFESPSTGIPEEEREETNALNLINESDFVPDIPLPEGRYGTDIRYWPDELDPNLYETITGESLDNIIGFTILNKWDNHLLDCSLTYVLSREKGLLRVATESESDQL